MVESPAIYTVGDKKRNKMCRLALKRGSYGNILEWTLFRQYQNNLFFINAIRWISRRPRRYLRRGSPQGSSSLRPQGFEPLFPL